MRNILLITVPVISCLASAFLTQVTPLRGSLTQDQQALMAHEGPGIVLPGEIDAPGDNDGQSGSVVVADVLGRDRSINIFASLSRDVESVTGRFQDDRMNATVLAPTNSALTALPRKPWEDMGDYEALGSNAYHGTKGEDRAQRNLRRFIEAHVVPQSPLKTGEKVEAMAGNTIWVEEKDGKKFIQPGNVEVHSIADKVANGEVWILTGVLNYAA